MSNQAMNWTLGKANSPGEQLVLMVIANYADQWGVSYVGQDTLAKDCSASRAMVQGNMKKLDEAGLLKRVRRITSGGRRTSDALIIAPNAVDRGTMEDANKIALTML